MPEELTEGAKAKMIALDKEQRIADLFEAFGSDERQRLTASKALGDKFEWNGARLSFKLGDEQIPATDPRVHEYFAKQWEFLLPPFKTADDKNGGDGEVDPLLVERALTSTNMTERGRLVTALSGNLVEANRLAQSYGLKSIHDTRAGTKPADGSHEKPKGDKPAGNGNGGKNTNPYSKEGWDVAAQGRLITQLGVKKAGEIAKAAGRSVTGAELPGYAA